MKLPPKAERSTKAERSHGSQKLKNILSQYWIHRIASRSWHGLDFRDGKMIQICIVIAWQRRRRISRRNFRAVYYASFERRNMNRWLIRLRALSFNQLPSLMQIKDRFASYLPVSSSPKALALEIHTFDCRQKRSNETMQNCEIMQSTPCKRKCASPWRSSSRNCFRCSKRRRRQGKRHMPSFAKLLLNHRVSLLIQWRSTARSDYWSRPWGYSEWFPYPSPLLSKRKNELKLVRIIAARMTICCDEPSITSCAAVSVKMTAPGLRYVNVRKSKQKRISIKWSVSRKKRENFRRRKCDAPEELWWVCS